LGGEGWRAGGGGDFFNNEIFGHHNLKLMPQVFGLLVGKPGDAPT